MSILESLLGGMKASGGAAKDALKVESERQQVVSTTLDKGVTAVTEGAQKTADFFKSLVPSGMNAQEVFPSANMLGADDVRGRTAELRSARVATSQAAGQGNTMAPAPGGRKWQDTVRPQAQGSNVSNAPQP